MASESVSVTVRKAAHVWEWHVVNTASRPPSLLGLGTAPSRETAWEDAATVVNDRGAFDG